MAEEREQHQGVKRRGNEVQARVKAGCFFIQGMGEHSADADNARGLPGAKQRIAHQSDADAPALVPGIHGKPGQNPGMLRRAAPGEISCATPSAAKE